MQKIQKKKWKTHFESVDGNNRNLLLRLGNEFLSSTLFYPMGSVLQHGVMS